VAHQPEGLVLGQSLVDEGMLSESDWSRHFVQYQKNQLTPKTVLHSLSLFLLAV